ncbi:radical SAM domain protein [Cavenderia fasciculata]|uniref:Radical SAM domain protein n=1 Tax=Cavenderia fasciculata TaxID=261658 RepID=F4PJ51_CACFS|nr:radical SAM domain protein [Cavenderia fasciculata]EGG24337.1 radical SAM domain protein [Cavenderia fasciculata]|eukprot:XP_004362188.1 radical SAM domain protein [Cavenderia fasciculata]
MINSLKKGNTITTRLAKNFNYFKRFYSFSAPAAPPPSPLFGGGGGGGGQRQLILVSQDWTRPKDPPLSLGHASLLTNLRLHQVDVIERSWSVNAPDFSSDSVTDFIMNNVREDGRTDVALGAFVWNEHSTKAILRNLKKHRFPGRIILGGPQASYLKSNIESYYPEVDYFIRGYAESAIVDLMKSNVDDDLLISTPTMIATSTGTSKPTSVGGTTPCSSGNNNKTKGIHRAGALPDLGLSATADLETLPSPFLSGTIKPQRFMRWETQRGCPFRCAFCQHRESDSDSDSHVRRHMSLTRTLQESEWITNNPVIQDLAVLDPIFNSGPNYLEILDQLLRGRYSGKLSLQCRLEMVKEPFLDRVSRLKDQGCQVVLEFGLQTIHAAEQKLIDRPNNIKRVVQILKEVGQRAIQTEISLIYGLPLQTVETFKETIDFCRTHAPNNAVIHAFPLMLLRGTPLFHRKHELGIIESNEIVSDNNIIPRLQSTPDSLVDIPHVVASPSFTYQDWKEMTKLSEQLEIDNQRIQLNN